MSLFERRERVSIFLGMKVKYIEKLLMFLPQTPINNK
jgi:hypothetical protein